MIPQTPAKWTDVLTQCQVKPTVAARWADVFAAEIGPGTFSAADAELDDFLGQVLHESGMLERVEEGLTYTTAARISAVWPRRFPDAGDAEAYVRNPAGLANKVYGGRMGNTEPGDGYKFRGRGLLQVTGKDNYRLVGSALGLDLISNPDLLATPAVALRASIAWWERRIPDAAMGDIVRVTKLVNGGTVGLDHRAMVSAAARKALAA